MQVKRTYVPYGLRERRAGRARSDVRELDTHYEADPPRGGRSMATLASTYVSSTYVSDGSPRRALCRTYVAFLHHQCALLLKLEERATGQPILNKSLC
jgi:hypothetical protein